MRQILRQLGSPRLTILLILSLTVLFLLGLMIPQKGVLQKDLYLQWKAASPRLVGVMDLLGVTDIYTSPLALALWSLFFLNLALVMWRRIPTVRSLVAVHPGKIKSTAGVLRTRPRAEIPLPEGCGRETAARFFRARRYRILEGPGGLYAVRNRLSPVATLVFHLSFFLILAGGAAGFYTRFTGRVELAEGETFTGDLARYVRPPRLPLWGEPPRVNLLLSRIEPQVVDDTPVGMRVTFTDEQDREHVVEINRPLRLGDCSLVVQDLGVAPLVVLADATGREIDGAWVKLDVLQGQTDLFQMADLDFTAAFFPDLVMVDGQPGTRSRQFANPALWLLVSRAGEILADTTVRPGEEILMGRMRLTVPEIRFWARFYVRQESGLWLVWTGFALATFALVWRLVFYRREYWVAYRQEAGAVAAVDVAGRAEFFRALFEEEFDSTVAQLRRHMADAGGHGMTDRGVGAVG